MQYTREQANKKWCPFARASGDSDGVNRLDNGDGDAACTCIADYCMAWQWAQGKDGEQYLYRDVYARHWYNATCRDLIEPLQEERAALKKKFPQTSVDEDSRAIELDKAIRAAKQEIDRLCENYASGEWLPEWPHGDGWEIEFINPHGEDDPAPMCRFRKERPDRLGYCALMKK